MSYIPAEFLPELASGDHSKILCGVSSRSSFQAKDALIAGGFDEIRQYWVLPDASYLSRDELTEKERATLARRLELSFRKFVIVWACAAAGKPTPAADAIGKLKELFPDIDFAVIDAIGGLRERMDGPPETRELKELLRKGLAFTEELYSRIQAVRARQISVDQ
jgi:hypothetical protein